MVHIETGFFCRFRQHVVADFRSADHYGVDPEIELCRGLALIFRLQSVNDWLDIQRRPDGIAVDVGLHADDFRVVHHYTVVKQIVPKVQTGTKTLHFDGFLAIRSVDPDAMECDAVERRDLDIFNVNVDSQQTCQFDLSLMAQPPLDGRKRQRNIERRRNHQCQHYQCDYDRAEDFIKPFHQNICEITNFSSNIRCFRGQHRNKLSHLSPLASPRRASRPESGALSP